MLSVSFQVPQFLLLAGTGGTILDAEFTIGSNPKLELTIKDLLFIHNTNEEG